MSIKLEKLLLESLRNEVWTQFMEALSEESSNLVTELIEPVKHSFDIDYQVENNNFNQLKEIASSFGYTSDVTLFPDDIDFLEREVRSIPFRITSKSLPVSYEYLFKAMGFVGEIALMYWDGQELVRQFGDITNLETINLTLPYRYRGNLLVDFLIGFLTLDNTPSLALDSSPFWTLDQQSSKIPTSHISLEFVPEELIDVNGTEYLVTKEYLEFLLRAANNNRKVTTTPHVTLSLSSIMDTSGFFNNGNRNAEYSTPAIKLKSAVESSLFDFNDTTFSKIEVGIGSNPVPAYVELPGIVSYFPMTTPDTVGEVVDYAENVNPGSSSDVTYTTGQVGEAAVFNGTTSTMTVPRSGICTAWNQPFTLSFWYWIDGDYVWTGQREKLVSTNGFGITLSSVEGSLHAAFPTLGYSLQINPPASIYDTWHHVSLTWDGVSRAEAILDRVSDVSTSSITVSGTPLAGDFEVGSEDEMTTFGGTGNIFKGKIDELYLFDKVILSAGLDILFNSQSEQRIAAFPLSLDSRIQSKEITFNSETNSDIEGENWKLIQSSFPGNTVNNEVVASGDGSTTSFSFTLPHAEISKNTVSIVYTYFSVDNGVSDDGEGILSGQRAEGTIDYLTGEVSIDTQKETDVIQKLHSGTDGAGNPVSGVSSINTFLGSTPILPGSFGVGISTGDGNNFFFVQDNGDGTIGAGDESDAIEATSSINYATGELTLDFTVTTDTGRDITSEYVYTQSSTPDSGTDLIASYNTEIDLDITEAGVFDGNGDLVIYSTFPPANLGNKNKYLGLQFFIRETAVSNT